MMRSCRTQRMVIVLASVSLIVAACGGGGKSASPTTSAGTLTYLLFNEITGFDPVVLTGSGGSDGVRAFAMFDSLVYNDATSGNVEPGTAASITSQDGVTWLVKVRPGVKFTDGTDYDSNA